MDAKSAYERRLEAQLNEWRRRIEWLRNRSDTMEEDRKAACREYIRNLEQRSVGMQAELEKLRRSNGRTFDDARMVSDQAWTDMEKAVSRGLVRFN